MSDLPRRDWGGTASRMQSDMQRAVSSLRTRSDTALKGPYTPAEGLFADPQPTTLAEALDRLSAAVFAAHGPIA